MNFFSVANKSKNFSIYYLSSLYKNKVKTEMKRREKK